MSEITALNGNVTKVAVKEPTPYETRTGELSSPEIAANKDAVQKATVTQVNFLETDICEGAMRELTVLDPLPIKTCGTKSEVCSLVRSSELAAWPTEQVRRCVSFSHDFFDTILYTRRLTQCGAYLCSMHSRHIDPIKGKCIATPTLFQNLLPLCLLGYGETHTVVPPPPGMLT